jgi:multiple sugar transport system permease protein
VYKQIHSKLRDSFKQNLLATPMIAIIAIVGIAPFIQAFITSFYQDIYGVKSFAGIENYKYLLSDKGFLYSFNISFLWSILNTIITILIGIILSWKLKHKKHKLLLIIAIGIPFAIPIYISVPIWRLFFHGDSGISLFYKLTHIEVNFLTDPNKTFIATLFINCWLSIPMNIIFFSSAFKKISKEIILSAKIDGANNFQILYRIIIPMVKNTTLTLIVLNAIKFLKDFNVPYMVSVGGPPLLEGITDHFVIGVTTTLDILIYEIFNSTSNYGITSAYSIIIMFIIALLMFLWLLTKSNKKHFNISLVLLLISQLIINRQFGLFLFIIYCSSILYKRNKFNKKASYLFCLGLVIELIYFFYSLATKGFLLGFDSAFFIPIIIYLTQIKQINKPYNLLRKSKKFYAFKISPSISYFIDKSYSVISLFLEIILIISSFMIIYLLLILSFSNVGSIYIDSIIPAVKTLNNFKDIIFKENYFLYIKNSLVLSTLTSVIIPFVIMPASFLLKQKTDKTTYSILTFFQIIGIYGGMHSLIPLFIIFSKLNATQTYLPLILIYLSHSIPIGLFTTLAFIDKFPMSLSETAKLEGVSTFQYFRYILFPLCIPIIFSNMLLTFLSAWNGFIAPLLFLNQDAKFTISVKLYSLVGNLSAGFPHWNLFAAGALINCIILLIIILIIERFSEYSFLEDIQE